MTRRPLTRQLAALILGLLVPTLLFVGVLLWRFAASERARVEEEARALSRGLAVALDREIVGILTTLQALGTSPSLEGGDLAGFYRQAMEIRRLQGIHVSVRDLEGRSLLTTRAPLGTSFSTEGTLLQDADREALRTRKAAVSDVFTGAVSGRPVFQVVIAVPTWAEPTRLLAASIDLDYLGDTLRRERLPQDWIGTIVDRRGVFVARSQDHDAYAGRPTSPDYRARAVAGDDGGSYYGRNTAGVEVLAGYARSPLTGWVASANLPAQAATAPLQRSLVALAGLGLALGVFALVLAGLARRRIVAAVGQVRDAARAIGRGEAVAPVATPVAEVDEVGQALAAASAALREREQERDRAEAALREMNATLEQRVAEAIGEREKAEAQLRQSQKMEAVGQLTGGVAHDFNNLLTVVTGNLDLLRRRLDGTAGADGRIGRSIENAMEGARRAAALTSRLLAFSRQSPLQPEVLDANKLVGGMSDLLRRTLGETVAIETVLAGGLWRCEAAPNQLENALLNLALNARDAMPDGGKLTIETANAYLDEAYAAGANGEVKPGQYVMVGVSDTGSGMAAEVKARVFEPFFTTKPVGKGTGLGLAQVYGFAKQSGGHVAVYSEPGQGTAVKLYFPRLRPAAAAAQAGAMAATPAPLPPSQPAAEAVPARAAGELVLVVEDEAMVRDFSVSALEDAGYRVLAAEDGPTALRLLERHRDELALLFTDVVLAGPLNGRRVADEAERIVPGLKVLFTTGYTRNAIIHHGRLDEGVDLIGKPFTAAGLANRVRQMLENGGGGGGIGGEASRAAAGKDGAGG